MRPCAGKGLKRRIATMLLVLGLSAACSGDAPRELGGPDSASPSPSSSVSPPTKTPAAQGTKKGPRKSSSTPKVSASSKGTPSNPGADCAAPQVPADGMALPAYDCPNSHPDRLLSGVRITGDAARGCVWIVYPNGTQRMALWYPGYWARFDPVRVYDSRGRLVWSELDPPRDIAGGFVEVFLDRIPEQCRVKDYPYPWWVIPFSSYERPP